MRATSKYIALFLATTFLAACMLWLPGWHPGSPPGRIAVVTARPFQALHPPFVLVRLYRQTTGYQAPLRQYSVEVVPNNYEVVLHPGYSMEEHKRFVGAELQDRITLENPRVPGYFAELDTATLQAVRADIGVDQVILEAIVTLDA